ncbi:hypothetical protein [Shewanella denitrificans]|nr:hypothetical protein [Shewanella denitrificans]
MDYGLVQLWSGNLKNIIKKTFGGLSTEYYLRQIFFAALFSAFILYVVAQGEGPIQYGFIGLLIANTLLYPYSRFVYENVVGFILGRQVFFVNAIFMLVVKLLTIALCWCLAIFIAPIGLLYLYFRNSK